MMLFFAMTVTLVMTFAMIAMVVVLLFVHVLVLTVFRHIDGVVPIILDKIDRGGAGAISSAVFTPVFGMAGWDMQIKWRTTNLNGLNDHRLVIYNRRFRVLVANFNLAIKARLSNADRNPDISCIS